MLAACVLLISIATLQCRASDAFTTVYGIFFVYATMSGFSYNGFLLLDSECKCSAFSTFKDALYTSFRMLEVKMLQSSAHFGSQRIDRMCYC